MQCNLKFDELMRPVEDAIKRHVKDSDAITDIYNRTYEALLIGMDENISRAERAEAIINGMFPMWVAAMSYCEHGRADDLERMRNYYNGRDNPLTSDQLREMLEIVK